MINIKRIAVGLSLVVALGAMGACDDLLDVDLPSALTDDALEDPTGAATQVNSVIALFECAYSTLAYQAAGHEDVWEKIAGVAGSAAQYDTTPDRGGCDSAPEDDDWYDNIQVGRALGVKTYARLGEWTDDEVDNRIQKQAIVALYIAANMDVLGEFFCEMAVDEGPLMSATETLNLGESWIATALGHISSLGDFEMPYGIASSATNMAMGLRARMKWSRGDLSGAMADANAVPARFTSWVIRGAGPQRRNKVYNTGTAVAYAGMLGVNDWWHEGPNPVTGQAWGSPIPFTGYLNLSLMADGRAVHDSGLPVRTTADAGSTVDTRVLHFVKTVQGPVPRDVPSKYTSDSDNIPLVSWQELLLIKAEAQGGQAAIDLVNELRTFHDLPLVTYADPGNATQIRFMIIEERRRELWLTSRFWATKILNTDILWFPRSTGFFPEQGYELNGGVRMVMPRAEYDLNENFTVDQRATGCDVSQRPTIRS
jgi:hypothetical protein